MLQFKPIEAPNNPDYNKTIDRIKEQILQSFHIPSNLLKDYYALQFRKNYFLTYQKAIDNAN